MDVGFIIGIMVLTGAVLGVGLFGYMRIYERYLNRALTEEKASRKEMMEPRKLSPWMLLIFLVVVTLTLGLDMAFDISHSRLTTREEILADVRLNIDETDTSLIAMGADAAAVLSYPPDWDPNENKSADFRVYLNSNSNLTDYTFRLGGGIASVDYSVCLMEHEGTFILVSMNAPRVAQVRCANGTTYTVDPDQPFVLVISDGGSILTAPGGSGGQDRTYSGIEVYDEHGNLMDLTEYEWFEMRTIG